MSARARALRLYALQSLERRWDEAWRMGDRVTADRVARVANTLRALGV
jgi:hypothetical protein